MRTILFFFVVIFAVNSIKAQEIKILQGRIIDDTEFKPVAKALIYNKEKVILDTCDLDGYFKIQASLEIDEIIIVALAMEPILVKITKDCQNIEVIMMWSSRYHYSRSKKNIRKYNKEFNDLSKLYIQAHKKNVFISKTPCFSYFLYKW